MTHDRLAELNQKYASERMASWDDVFRSEMTAMAQLEHNIHLGVDAFGNRLTTEERRIVVETLDNLMLKLSSKYTSNNLSDLNRFLARKGFNNLTVKKRLLGLD